MIMTIMRLIIGYFLAASVTEAVSYDFSVTDWENVMTYIYLLIGYIVTWVLFLIILTVVLAALGVSGNVGANIIRGYMKRF